MKFWLAERMDKLTSFFHNRANPPEAGVTGAKRYCSSKFSSSSSFETNSSGFFVSDRKITSGEDFLLSSLSLWTVLGFPNPQQFQLKMTKEEGEEGCENPMFSSPG